MSLPVPQLELRGVVAGYGSVDALHGVSMRLPRGAVVALLGTNGAGKSSTLKVIAGQLPVRAGELRWQGRRLASIGSPYRRSVGGIVLIPEGRGIFPGLSVHDNLKLFARAATVPLEPAFAAFPILAQRLQQRAGSLSGGEQQMLALSRALLGDPTVLLLDEMSLGLAPIVTAELFAAVAALRRPDRTIVIVEQYLQHALAHADVAYVLTRGRVSFAGDPAEARAHLTEPADA